MRQEEAPEKKGAFYNLMKWVKETLKPVFKTIGRWFHEFMKFILERLPSPSGTDLPPKSAWQGWVRWSLFCSIHRPSRRSPEGGRPPSGGAEMPLSVS